MRVSGWSPLGWAALGALLVSACGPKAGDPATPAPPGRAAAPEAKASGSILTTGKKLYSQHDEELIARDYFQDRRGGFFLDVGCATPIADNNTYYLESELGWSGIGVDALPEFAPAWERKRPRSKFFSFFVSDHSDTVEPFYRSQFKGTSSGRAPDGQLKGPGGKPVRTEEIQVPTTTLDKLLDGNGVTQIDYLSMDIEGYEPVALAGFDIERFKPRLACVEVKPPVRDKIMAYFARHGYEHLERYVPYDEVNYYFAPKAGK